MITSGLCYTAKRDFLRGMHTPQDEYRIALYGPLAELGPELEYYTIAGEVNALGYERGGQVLRGYQCVLDGTTAALGWREPAVWEESSILAYGAVIYNATKGGRALVVTDFGGRPLQSVSGRFRLVPPPLTAEMALIRVG